MRRGTRTRMHQEPLALWASYLLSHLAATAAPPLLFPGSTYLSTRLVFAGCDNPTLLPPTALLHPSLRPQAVCEPGPGRVNSRLVLSLKKH
jgi:hypothetical protein